ncbi:MAG: hypothetical protein ACFFAN_10910 [Promethearchaeota archaeon]
MSLIDLEVVISKSDIQKKLRLSKNEINVITDYLVSKGYIKFKNVKNEKIFSLTHEGKKYYDKKLKYITFNEQFQRSGKKVGKTNIFNKFSIDKFPSEENLPSFIGCFIADKNGKTLLTFELFDGALDYYLKGHIKDEERKEQLDIELIPLFISALEKFSEEINIRNLWDLKIKGANLKMRSFSYEKFTITFFINPNVNLKPVENKIKGYFEVLFKKYKNELELSLRTGLIENISHLNKLGREMLKELNKFVFLGEFKNIVNDLEFFDIIYARSLYNKLDELYNEFTLKFSIILEKIKQLKINLLKSILNEDLEEFKSIINKTQNIKSILRYF